MANQTKEMGQRSVLGFDFGKKFIGIAIGQELTGSASPLGSVKANDGIPNWDNIEKYLKEWLPDYLVVGLPLNMDGTEQPLTKAAKKFGNRLHGRFGLPVEFQDERLTTADAKERLFAQGGYKNLTKDNVDALSASLIIESYFEHLYSNDG
jgi:putative Holliday junction resolvase